jgi:hypothetical protein
MKKIYIPDLKITGNYLEELGTQNNITVYPGESFELSLNSQDFENNEEYHTVWIALTKAVQKKLSNGPK